MNPYLNQYQSTQVTTASPEQILIMLYDGAIRFVNQISKAVEAGDIQSRNTFTNKTVAILSELNATLDHEIGGEIAANLSGLYTFMIAELGKVTVKNDKEPLKVVLNILTELREAWVGAAEIVRKERAAGKGPGREGQSVAAAL